MTGNYGNGFVQETLAAVQGAAGTMTPEIGAALEACFGAGVNGIDFVRGTGADAAAVGAEAFTIGDGVNMGGWSASEDDLHAVEILGHETAHAMAPEGSRDTVLPEAGDRGERGAEDAGVRFRRFVASGMQGAPPRIAAARGGRAAIHRYTDDDGGASRYDMLDELDLYATEAPSENQSEQSALEAQAHQARLAQVSKQAGRGLTFKEKETLLMNGRYTGSAPAVDMNAPVDLDSPQGRLEFMSTFTQGGVGDPNGAKMCGPTSILTGMVYAKGASGVEDLMAAIEAKDPSHALDHKALKAKIEAGEPLTMGDMHQFKTQLADHINVEIEGQDPAQLSGTKPETMDGFINQNPDIQQAFAEHHMSIDGVDVGRPGSPLPDGSPEHAVLRVADDSGETTMVYDPSTRKAGATDGEGMGPQVIQDPDMLEAYGEAKAASVEAKPGA
jgi:hypothetical protein